MSNKTKIFVGAAAVLLVIAVICVIVFGDKNNDPQPISSSAPALTDTSNYDVTGVWYSDRENGDTLTLDEDGTYTSSNWLANGEYAITGNVLTLTDLFGDSKALIIASDGDTYMLKYAGASAHTYYRTEQEASTAQEQQIAADEEMQSLYNAALSQILTTGDWVSVNERTTLTFTDTTITLHYDGTESEYVEAATVNYTYAIVSFEVKSGSYIIIMDCHNESDNNDYKNTQVGITVGEDNLYTMTGGCFAYARVFNKTVAIDFTQPQPTSSSAIEQDIAEANSTSDGAGIIAPSSRDNNPDDSGMMEAAYAAIEEAIYGTWKGTYDDMIKASTVYWVFTFNKDGTYSFTDGSRTETGTFVLGRNNGNVAYMSNVQLTPKDGEAYTLDFTVTGNPINALHINADYPTFFKE